MKKILFVTIVFSSWVIGLLPVTPAQGFNLATTRAVNSVWQLAVTYPSGGSKFPPIVYLGTAWVIHSYKGIGTFWVTSRHVLRYYEISSKNIAKISFLYSPYSTSPAHSSGTYLRVLAVAKSSKLDVAILRTEYVPGVQPLHINYSQVPYGTEVTSIGYGYPNTTSKNNNLIPNYPWISSGILTTSSSVWMDGTIVSGVLLHSNPIYHGNSGGPLLDSQANVVGMDEGYLADSNDVFVSACAIPVNLVASTVNDLIYGMKSGRG